MDEFDTTNQWLDLDEDASDPFSIANRALSEPARKVSYDDSDEFGGVDKSPSISESQLEMKIGKIRELQQGRLDPEQVFATGALSLIPGIVGYFAGGNEGAASGFAAGGKAGSGYVADIFKQNQTEAGLRSDLLKQEVTADTYMKRLDAQNQNIIDRQRLNRNETTDELLERKRKSIEQGLVADPQALAESRKGQSFSPDELVTVYGFNQETANALAGKPIYAQIQAIYGSGNNKKLIESSAIDKMSVGDAALKEIDSVKELINQFDYAPEGAGFLSRVGASAQRLADRTFDAGSPEALYTARIQPIVTAVARLRDVGALSNQDRNVVAPLLGGRAFDLATLSKQEQLGALDYAAKLIAGNRDKLIENYSGARRAGLPVRMNMPQGNEYMEVDEGVKAAMMKQAQQDGLKVVDDTVSGGVQQPTPTPTSGMTLQQKKERIMQIKQQLGRQ